MKNIQTLKRATKKPKAQVATIRISREEKPLTKANEALKPQVTSAASFTVAADRKLSHF
jgi:hypothetical protein